jgi:starvation-inducible DNA-binding protein
MLADNLKVLLGSTFAFYVKIHGFHFNIEGDNFPQYHEFLGDFYTEVYGSIDPIGEYIRTLDSYTPGSLTAYAELTIIQDKLKIPRAELMFAESLQDCMKMIALVVTMFDIATEERQQGIANFMAELQDLYAKKAWMIRSILKKEREKTDSINFRYV